MRAGGKGSWGCIIFWKIIIIHYYYCQSEGGEDSSQGGGGNIPPFHTPPPRKYPVVISFQQILKKPKAMVFRGPKKCVEKSNPSESKRKEKLNGTCFSCIAHVGREL